MKGNNIVLTRASLLLAMALLFQSLRFFIPIPPFFSTFLVGSLVNGILLIAVQTIGLWPAILIASVTPIVAYFQQLLILPVFIFPVALGNSGYACLFLLTKKWGRGLSIGFASLGKATFLYFSFLWLLSFINLDGGLVAGLLFVMSWPQFITGIMGGFLADIVVRRLKLILPK